MREFEQKKIANHSSSTFFGPKVQKKLTTGTVGDKYEVEADNVADKVVNKRKTGGLLQSKSEEAVQQKPISETISTVQKQDLAQEQPLQKKGKEKEDDKKVQKKSDKEEDKKVQKKGEKEDDKKVQKKSDKEEDKKVQKKGEKEEDKKVQKKCADCEGEDKKAQKKEEKNTVQAKLNESNSVNEGVESDLNSSKGSGNGMDKNTKQEMESGFGADFSNVNIHTDSKAVQMSEQLGAQAFTHGNDVYFNKGKYNPNSKEGKHLLAHELTHTIQQTGAKQKSGAIQKSSIENYSKDLQAGNNKLQRQKKDGGNNCCSGEYELPQKDYSFDINDSVMTGATFCSKGNFKISSTANWAKTSKEEHYHIRLVAIQGGTINKTTRRYNVGKTETQLFTVKSKDCIFFKVEVEVINPKISPNLKGSFSVTN